MTTETRVKKLEAEHRPADDIELQVFWPDDPALDQLTDAERARMIVLRWPEEMDHDADR